MKPDTSTAITDDDVLRAYPDVPIDHDNKGLYRGWLARELRLHRCTHCGHRHHPPQPCCPRCWSTDVRPQAVSGRGTVYSIVLLHGLQAPGITDSEHPHPVVTVELDEQPGLRWTSTLIDRDPRTVRIGDPVDIAWIERHGQPYPVFRARATT